MSLGFVNNLNKRTPSTSETSDISKPMAKIKINMSKMIFYMLLLCDFALLTTSVVLQHTLMNNSLANDTNSERIESDLTASLIMSYVAYSYFLPQLYTTNSLKMLGYLVRLLLASLSVLSLGLLGSVVSMVRSTQHLVQANSLGLDTDRLHQLFIIGLVLIGVRVLSIAHVHNIDLKNRALLTRARGVVATVRGGLGPLGVGAGVRASVGDGVKLGTFVGARAGRARIGLGLGARV